MCILNKKEKKWKESFADKSKQEASMLRKIFQFCYQDILLYWAFKKNNSSVNKKKNTVQLLKVTLTTRETNIHPSCKLLIS